MGMSVNVGTKKKTILKVLLTHLLQVKNEVIDDVTSYSSSGADLEKNI
jgi:hypothetical protein